MKSKIFLLFRHTTEVNSDIPLFLSILEAYSSNSVLKKITVASQTSFGADVVKLRVIFHNFVNMPKK